MVAMDRGSAFVCTNVLKTCDHMLFSGKVKIE